MRKDNWNLFVGDTKFKTNFFMQFKDAFTKKLYDRHLITSGIYSLRLILISMCLLDFFADDSTENDLGKGFLQQLLPILLMIVSLFGTSKKSK